MKGSRAVAVIQARMGSSRLPGKMLEDLAGSPVLEQVIRRAQTLEGADEVVLATTVESRDDPLAELGACLGVTVVRGPEEDVLARFLAAVDVTGATAVARICADAPLFDPGFLDRCLALLVETDADVVLPRGGVGTLYHGAEVISTRALRWSGRVGGQDPLAREHVTAYAYRNSTKLHSEEIDPDPALAGPPLHLSIDTAEDLERTRRIFEALGGQGAMVPLAAAAAFVRGAAPRAVIRCDGGDGVGMGHVVRCLALAEALRDDNGFWPLFAMRKGRAGFDLVQGRGFGVVPGPEASDEAGAPAWLAHVLERTGASVLVLDSRDGLRGDAVKELRRSGVLVADLDDPEDKRLEADLCFLPPVPQLEGIDWSASSCIPHVGWPWVVLRRDVAELEAPTGRQEQPVMVLVSMGGEDPVGLTVRAVEALAPLGPDVHVRVVLGPAFSDDGSLDRALQAAPRTFEILRAPEGFLSIAAASTVALVSFGVTAYELAVLGVPAVYVCLTPDHAESASAFVAAGMGRSLGVHEEVGGADMLAAVEELLADSALRQDMAATGGRLVDGRGARRVAQVIADAAEGRGGAS